MIYKLPILYQKTTLQKTKAVNIRTIKEEINR